jgi:hypothetical protein
MTFGLEAALKAEGGRLNNVRTMQSKTRLDMGDSLMLRASFYKVSRPLKKDLHLLSGVTLIPPRAKDLAYRTSRPACSHGATRQIPRPAELRRASG